MAEFSSKGWGEGVCHFTYRNIDLINVSVFKEEY